MTKDKDSSDTIAIIMVDDLNDQCKLPPKTTTEIRMSDNMRRAIAYLSGDVIPFKEIKREDRE